MSDSLKQMAKIKRTTSKEIVTLQDPLGGLLHLLKMNSVFYTHSDLTTPWGFSIPAIPKSLMFHLVVEGHCFIEVEGIKTRLEAGDFMMLPHGKGHKLFDQANSECPELFDLPIQSVSEFYETLTYGGGGETTILLCGAVSFDHPIAERLLDTMPSYIKIDSQLQETNKIIHQVIEMVADETLSASLGGEAVITRLADILVIHALRAWLSSEKRINKGWLAAMSDNALSKAMLAIHQNPEKSWSVELLAKEAYMSRTTFSERFKQVVGETPLNYLTKWRMDLAKSKLLLTKESILEIALGLGYQSEAAFSRAYKKVMGEAPSHTRKLRLNDLSQ
jgi:AraC-like DNA-binding protein